MKLGNVLAKREKKTVYQDGETVVKVFEPDFSKADILNEALNQARVEETGLPVPKVLSVTQAEGKWAIVTDYIQGKTLAQLMEEHPEKEDEYLELFLKIQMEIHTKKAPLLNSQKDKMERKMLEADIDATTRYELQTRLEGMPRHDKVCHGDFNPSNIIVKDDGTAYVLDWSHATKGNASVDVARTYLLFRLGGQLELAEKYLKAFCEKSKTDLTYVQKWLPIVAASQWVKGNKEEREFLEKWISVVEYE